MGYFLDTFSLKVKDDAKPFEALPRCIAYTLPDLFKKRKTARTILATLGVDETGEWYNSFVVPKHNGTVHLCLDQARPNQVLIRPIHIGPILSDTLQNLANVHFMTIIDVRSG